MMPIRFRYAVEGDLCRIVEIYNSTIASRMVTADTEPVSVESKQEWFKQHSPDKRPLWVVENEVGQLIAWASFQSFYGRPAYDGTVEVSIYIDTAFRGKGIGKEILQFCIEYAPNFGIKTLLGFIFAHNYPSLKLFEHLGFSTWGTFPKVAVLDETEVDLLILGKRLC